MITDHDATLCVKFHNSEKCQIVDFVPDFVLKKGSVFIFLCSNVIGRPVEAVAKKKFLKMSFLIAEIELQICDYLGSP